MDSSRAARTHASLADKAISTRQNAHVGSISVEDAYDANPSSVLAVELETQRFTHPLALVVARSDASAAHVTPVRLWLRVHVRIPVYLSACERRRREM